MIAVHRIRAVIGDIPELWRKPVVNEAAADLVPLAVDWASIPGLDPSHRERCMRLAEERYAR